MRRDEGVYTSSIGVHLLGVETYQQANLSYQKRLCVLFSLLLCL